MYSKDVHERDTEREKERERERDNFNFFRYNWHAMKSVEALGPP